LSETAPEPAPAPTGGGGNTFSRKLGPLPLWAWMGIGLALALTYYYFKQNKASASASNQASNSQAGNNTAAGTTDSSLVPQFVNQTYVQNAPPSAPPTTPSPVTTTTPPATNTQVSQYPAPTGLKVAKITNTSAKVNWNYLNSPTPKPTSYTIAAYQTNGKLAQYITVNAPDTSGGTAQATLSGLHPGWTYNVKVWANGGKVAPPGATEKLTL
jgi:hypothetical protein